MIDTTLYKEILEKELHSLTKALQDLGIHNPQVKEDWIALPEDVTIFEADENVSADRVEDWDERNATVSALEVSYNNIIHALTKIEQGTFGICEIGGEEIEVDRLEADPSARTCKAHLDEEVGLSF
jgi:RNA polymerase-binding transcription factor DksA